MVNFTQILQPLRRWVAMALLLGFVLLQGLFADPAQATPRRPQDESAKGGMLSAVIDCMPEQLSEPDLPRALDETTNDFLERVFNLKDGEDYEFSQAEKEFRSCLQRKGMTPQLEQNS